MLSAVKKYKYVSFDIFDTLIVRSVGRPEEVFNLIEEKAEAEHPGFYKGFSDKRILAAEKAYKKDKKEATLEDIYEELDYDVASKAYLMSLEIDAEIDVACGNQIAIYLLKAIRDQGKKIIIASDMYLPQTVIEAILDKNDIPYDYIYVSSEIQARKSTGEMFEYILKDIGAGRRDIIHVGDNLRSDVTVPKILGIRAHHWKDYKTDHLKKLKDLSTIEAEKLYTDIIKHNSKSYYHQIGYDLFGPPLFGFCNWIHEKAEDMDALCFLSRDGQIVHKAYSRIFAEEHPYLLASRRSLTVPLLKDADSMEAVLERIPYIKREETVKDFLHKVGIEDVAIEEQLTASYGESISRAKLKEYGSSIFPVIEQVMKENASKEYTAACRYLKNTIPKGNVALVDIGWYGTMQDCMSKICSEEEGYNFKGLYLGLLSKKYNSNRDINAAGYVYDFREKSNFAPELIYGFNGLIEIMFTANHGSMKKYVFEEDTVKCVLEEEHGEYNDFVKEVQAGALEFIEDHKAENLVDKNITYSGIHDLLTHPTENECAILGELFFYDAYFEKLIKYEGIGTALREPKREVSRFLSSNWKIGYIKRLIPWLKNPQKPYLMLERIK